MIKTSSVLALSMTQRYSFIKMLQQIAQFIHYFFLLCVEFSSVQLTVDQLKVQLSSDLFQFQCYGDFFWSSQVITKWIRIDSVHGNQFQRSDLGYQQYLQSLLITGFHFMFHLLTISLGTKWFSPLQYLHFYAGDLPYRLIRRENLSSE